MGIVENFFLKIYGIASLKASMYRPDTYRGLILECGKIRFSTADRVSDSGSG